MRGSNCSCRDVRGGELPREMGDGGVLHCCADLPGDDGITSGAPGVKVGVAAPDEDRIKPLLLLLGGLVGTDWD
jgi:hypothetical protein